VRRKHYWLRGGLLSFAAATLIDSLVAAAAGDYASFLAGMQFVFIATALGALVGAIADKERRERPAIAPPPPTPPAVSRLPLWTPAPGDVWYVLAGKCRDSVQRAGEAIALAPPSAATDWLWQLHARMVAELTPVDRLAALARSELPHEAPTASAKARALPVHAALVRATAEFEASRHRVASIVERLLGHPDLAQVEIELRMLEKELPVLAGPEPR
jgi:hypothetical protein